MRPVPATAPDDPTVYLTIDPESGPRWVDSERRRRLADRLTADEVAADEHEAHLEAARARFEELHHIRPAVVAGPIVFEYVFTRPGVPIGEDARLRHIAMGRWRVHRPDADRFIVVRQRRRKLSPGRSARWQENLDQIANTWRGAGLHEAAVATRSFVESSDDAARWTAEIEPAMGLEALLSWIDAASDAPGRPHGPNDEVSVPFLLRKALLEHGVDVPGTVRHGFD